MQTLWTFGCSHTQGHGLPDCVDENNNPINNTSQYAWPSHLAELIQLPLINNSHAGIGPKAVWHNVINSDIQPDDVIVIMWPCWETRIDLLIDPKAKSNHALQIQAVRVWQEEDKEYFANYYHKHDRWVEWHLLARHIQDNYPNNKLIQTTYNLYHPVMRTNLPSKLHVDFTRIAFGMHKYNQLGYALDGTHLGVEAHEAFAQDLYEDMK